MPPKVWKLKAASMSTAGMTVSKIANELRMDRSEVLAYLISRQAEGIASWTSAKTRITNRLKSLIDEEDREKREALVIEASKYVNYLYKKAKTLSNESPRKAADQN